ncbi:F0F1 ATP synthase subunit B [candidate division TA06 bacterium]|nr:F0F1 ATP synthase subunit B [candidate division TA06 bacterium]
MLENFPDPGLMFWTVITFLLLLFVLKRVAFKPIVGALENRQRTIQDSVEAAKKTKEEAESLLKNYEKQLANSQAESRKILEEGRTLGEKMKGEIIVKAREESSQILKTAREEIDREKVKVLVDLRKEVADLTITAASKVINQSLNRKDHVRLIDETISQVSQAKNSKTPMVKSKSKRIESASLADPARGQGGENRAGGSAEGSGSAGGITLIPIGKRGYDYFRRRGFSIFAFFSQPPNVVTQTEVEEITSSLLKGYGRDFHELHLLYTQFESAIRSRPVILQLLPLGNPEGGIRNSSVSQAGPARGLGEENRAGDSVGGSGSAGIGTPHSRKVEPLLEPEAEKMVKELLPKYISAELYGAMSESLASEQGARMVAMRSATDNAEDMIKNLTLRYNKSRQASITKELLEVITGAEALRTM